MSWWNDIGAGLGNVVDMFSGMPSGSTAAGAGAASDAFNNSYVGSRLDFGKSTGLAPYMQMLGLADKSKPAETVDTPFGPRPVRTADEAGERMGITNADRAVPYTAAERADIERTGGLLQAGGSDYVTSGVTGTQESKSGYKTTDLRTGVQTDEKNWSLPSYQNWDAVRSEE